jgi:Domain of unknown function (DUF2703)
MELKIRWQPLADRRGRSCERCLRTAAEIDSAAQKLRKALRPLGVDVPAIEVSPSEAAPLESNRLWMNDRPLEAWLGAEVGRSPCTGACGRHECRALYINGRRYEIVPEELLVKAGLIAAARLLGAKAEGRRHDRLDIRRSAKLN